MISRKNMKNITKEYDLTHTTVSAFAPSRYVLFWQQDCNRTCYPVKYKNLMKTKMIRTFSSE